MPVYSANVPLCTRSETIGVPESLSVTAERWRRATGIKWKIGDNVTWHETFLQNYYAGFFVAQDDTHCVLLLQRESKIDKERILMHEYGHALAGSGHPENGNVMLHEDTGSCLTTEDLNWVCARRTCAWMKPECKGEKQ